MLCNGQVEKNKIVCGGGEPAKKTFGAWFSFTKIKNEKFDLKLKVLKINQKMRRMRKFWQINAKNIHNL